MAVPLTPVVNQPNILRTDVSPVCVMAGPGTGKTYRLKQRVTSLLNEGVDPRQILVVTFTRTAAADLVRELENLGVPGCEHIRAGTLHSFCFRLLNRQDAFSLTGRVPRPLITFMSSGVSQFEASPLIADIKKPQFGQGRDCTKRILAYEAAWARQQQDIPGWAQEWLDQDFERELVEWLRFHGAMLIGELIPEALSFLQENPAVLGENCYEHVIVDEYQDLNRAEQVLVDTIAEVGALVVVGDADQSIYSFRHAHPEGINEFSSVHVQTAVDSFIECRRCPQRIVELANTLISENYAVGTPPRLVPYPDNPAGEINIVQWRTLNSEINGVSQYIHHLVNQQGIPPGEILILCPRRLIGYELRARLSELEIPAHSFYQEEALASGEARLAFCKLSLLANPNDRVALRYWLGAGSSSWLAGTYKKLRDYCETNGVSPWDALEQLEAGHITRPRIQPLVDRFSLIKAELLSLQGSPIGNVASTLFPADQEWASLLSEAAQRVINDDTTPASLLTDLRDLITQPELPEDAEYVQIMSLHKSKGLTRQAVIVCGCIEGFIPTTDEDEPFAEQARLREEQRRLFYVSITRTRNVLLLSSARDLPNEFRYQGAKFNRHGDAMASSFLRELGPTAPRAVSGEEWVRRGFA